MPDFHIGVVTHHSYVVLSIMLMPYFMNKTQMSDLQWPNEHEKKAPTDAKNVSSYKLSKQVKNTVSNNWSLRTELSMLVVKQMWVPTKNKQTIGNNVFLIMNEDAHG